MNKNKTIFAITIVGTTILIGILSILFFKYYVAAQLETLPFDQLMIVVKIFQKTLMVADLIIIISGTAITFKDKYKISKAQFNSYCIIYGTCFILFVISFFYLLFHFLFIFK